MEHKFEPGDTVVCVQHGVIGWEDSEYTRDDGIEIGEEFTVTRYIPRKAGESSTPGIYVSRIDEDYEFEIFHPDHFGPAKISNAERIAMRKSTMVEKDTEVSV